MNTNVKELLSEKEWRCRGGRRFQSKKVKKRGGGIFTPRPRLANSGGKKERTWKRKAYKTMQLTEHPSENADKGFKNQRLKKVFNQN